MTDGTQPESLISAFNQAVDIHQKIQSGKFGKDGLNQSEAIRTALRLMMAGQLCFLESDPAYPFLLKQQSPIRQFQLPSADAVYHYSRLDGQYRYRIRGNRGSAHILQFSVWNGSCSNLKNYSLASKLDNYDSAELAPGNDIEIILSTNEQPGLWMKIPEGPCEIYIRQYYADWDKEQPADFKIENTDAEYPPPPPDAECLSDGLSRIASWLTVQSDYYEKALQAHLQADAESVPVLEIPEAFQDNVYLCGYYQCKQDEAVILDVPAPQAKYWGFQLASLQWEAMDYHQRQTSLNFHQAHLDIDGHFRAVIAHQDPGVVNWLDANGRETGLISGRYFKTADQPIPKLTTVSLHEISRHLPDDTLCISPGERQDILKQRLDSLYARRVMDT